MLMSLAGCIEGFDVNAVFCPLDKHIDTEQSTVNRDLISVLWSIKWIPRMLTDSSVQYE